MRGRRECGACTVLIDGAPVNACLVPIAQVDGSRVITIEGLGGRHPLQRAFVEYGGAQCGICTPGMIMAAVALGRRPSMERDAGGPCRQSLSLHRILCDLPLDCRGVAVAVPRDQPSVRTSIRKKTRRLSR